jgi:hypothetical protein
MTTPNQQVRRATIEDVPKLVPLWKEEHLPWEALEKRFKEFQVVDGEGGELVGAIGLGISGTEGRLHSEVFARQDLADTLRELIWERIQVVAKNYGLVRIWCQFTTPFWNRSNFQYAEDSLQAAKLPQAFAGNPAPWRFLQLREESGPTLSVDREFAAFKELEKQNTDRLFQQAKMLKVFAGIVVMAVCILVVVWIFAWMKARGTAPR